MGKISVQEIAISMESYQKKCFDTVEGVMVDFENQDSKRYIELPELNEVDIIHDFIDTQSCEILKCMKKIEDIQYLIGEFHIVVNDLQIYDEWISYRNDYIKELAEKWYKGNEIYRF